MNFEMHSLSGEMHVPEFVEQSKILVARLQELDRSGLQKLMGVSAKLADVNHYRYQHFDDPIAEKIAILAFSGDVYSGLQAHDFSKQELEFAERHVRILSGLYGLLRPMDKIRPHRLEMASRLVTDAGGNLYDFWGNKITKKINQDLGGEHSVLINLASDDYFRAIHPALLSVPVIKPHFKQWRHGSAKTVGLLAKRGRGLMTRFAIKNSIRDPQQLKFFSDENYNYNAELSDADNWVFVR